MWTDVDPDRTGILPFVWDENFGFERYVEYALDVPMYFLYQHGTYEDATQQRCTFREYMEGKYPAHPGVPCDELPVANLTCKFHQHMDSALTACVIYIIKIRESSCLQASCQRSRTGRHI